ncbi:MAG: hypothetical protein JWQ14_1873 [Adhaeribacter sp.]|nr:hypothetical protein [Adhaeribacter sp.]
MPVPGHLLRLPHLINITKNLIFTGLRPVKIAFIIFSSGNRQYLAGY